MVFYQVAKAQYMHSYSEHTFTSHGETTKYNRQFIQSHLTRYQREPVIQVAFTRRGEIPLGCHPVRTS